MAILDHLLESARTTSKGACGGSKPRVFVVDGDAVPFRYLEFWLPCGSSSCSCPRKSPCILDCSQDVRYAQWSKCLNEHAPPIRTRRARIFLKQRRFDFPELRFLTIYSNPHAPRPKVHVQPARAPITAVNQDFLTKLSVILTPNLRLDPRARVYSSHVQRCMCHARGHQSLQ